MMSNKHVHRWAQRTGLPIEQMIGSAGASHWAAFRTADHRHGALHLRDGDIEWDDEDDPDHWDTCEDRFGPE